ncbi:hypothetical protein LIER_30071 [Lithospermum erythrorhizon]|uniref:SANT domain-containing protein n=1 Tax=Lithospermum erythrorhizon TaxID=34254 RepID=A0AAV3RN80_LITER
MSKHQHESNAVVGSLGTMGQKLERESSLNSSNWKTLKWTRSNSLSVRTSGFSHSSSSKSMEPDSSEMKMESMQKNVFSVLSPPLRSADEAFSAETSNAEVEETNSRKKPRLGWGEGLAKYEKKKVGSTDESGKNGATNCGSDLEPSHSYASNLTSKSPKFVMVSEHASPATPSSVACSSSPGLEGKNLTKDGFTDHDSANICNSVDVTQNNSDKPFNLEELDLATISNLNSSIKELLQPDDPTVESSFVRSTAMNKLLLLKNSISKAVEKTETEIDMLENELKAMFSESENCDNHLYASRSVPTACFSKPHEDHSAASNVVVRPARLHVEVDSGIASKDEHLVVKDTDVDSPGSATSKFVEASLSKDVSSREMLREIEVIGDPDLNMTNVEMKPETGLLVEENPIGLSSDGIDPQLVGSGSVASDDIASEVTHKLLPSSGYHFDFSTVVEASCVRNDLVKELFSRKNYYYKLKEKILTLKFKMLQHLWKKDMHTLSLKMLRGKAQKKCEIRYRNANSSYQKLRPFRLRCLSTGLSPVDSAESLSYASRLLTEPQIKPLRSALKMPSLIINMQEKTFPRFISYNGVVEDPVAVERERSVVNPWSPEEEELFIDKLALFGKDFRKIASFLDHKTTADCVEFYYKNHKSDSFWRAKNKPEFPKQSPRTYMRPSINQSNREALDILGAASEVAAKIDDCVEIQQKHISKSFLVSGSYKMESGCDNLADRSSSLCLYNSEREAVAADVLAGICGSLSSEAMSSCITSSLDPGEGYQDLKYQKMGSSTRLPSTPEVTQNVVETCSDESCGEIDPTNWTDEEKILLIQAVSSYGKDFTMISRCVRTKTQDQCKVFFSKARKCLGLDNICPRSENLIADDVNRGTPDACFLENGSGICNGKSGSRIDDDMASVNLKFAHDPVKDISKNLLPDDQGTEDNFELVFDGHQNGNSPEVIPDLDVAHDDGQENTKNLPKVLETEAQSVHLNAACIEVPKAKPDVGGSLYEINLAANDLKTKETSTRPSLQDEHGGVLLAGSEFLQRTLESGVKEKPHVLQQSGPAMADQGSSISTLEHGKCIYDNASVVPGMKYYKMNEQHLPEISLVEQMPACKVEQYPVAVSTIKEASCDISSKRLIPQGNNGAHHLSREFHLQRCHSRKSVSLDAELASVPREEDHSVPPSGNQLHINSLSTNGDVKLFGQILHKTSHHKPNLSARISEGCSSQHHSLGSKSSSVKCSSSQQAVDELSAHMKHGHNNIVGLDNLPLRNVVFRDQNRIHTGSSTLPDSTVLLARYPTEFSNYVLPSSKIELPSLDGVVKSGECILNGASTFSNKDVGTNNGSADLQMYGNKKVQSYSLDMRHRHDHLLAEMQRRNGCDVVPGLQQQSAGVVAINVVGRGPVLGGQFVSVSDPVAAIRMHYANSEQQKFSGGYLAANIIREEDSWRGKGSVGR